MGRGRRQTINLVIAQLFVPLLSFSLLAFLYLPIFEANLNYLDTIGLYNGRSTPGYSLESALFFFTPKHFWQSYHAMKPEPGWPPLRMEAWAFHTGVLVSLVAARGVGIYHDRRTTAVSVCAALLVVVTVGQLFGIPPFSLIDHLPFFSFVRNEYWPAMAGIPIALLVALGLEIAAGGARFVLDS